MRNIFILLNAFLLFIAGSCMKDTNKPLANDGKAPAPVSNIRVENLPGGASISYSLPTDEDILYVVASYVDKKGETVEFKSSYYTNTILVEGFGDMNEHALKLYAVDNGENRSTPVQVTIKPLEPPVLTTAKSLEIVPDFGGLSITYKNPSKASMAIVVCTTDSLGDMAEAETFYTQRESGKFSVRGFTSDPRKFSIVVRDKWDNYSDTISTTLTPIYEIMLDKKKFKALILPGDSPATAYDGALEKMWDGISTGDGGAHTGTTPDPNGLPKYFSFDLGVTAQLSRVNIHPIADDKHMFNDVSPRLYEIWGSTNPDPTGSFNGWTKLVTVENIKPSGLPVGILTEDDRIYDRHGDDADVSLNMPKVRYIRIRCLKNWSGNTNMVINEITFWGNDK